MNAPTIEAERTQVAAMVLEPLLTVDEAARILRRSHWTIRKYVAGGSIQGVRMGRDLLIEPCELRRFITKGKL